MSRHGDPQNRLGRKLLLQFLHSRHPWRLREGIFAKQKPKSRVAFLFGDFFFGHAKKKLLAQEGEIEAKNHSNNKP
jgi:hypothetical protein